MTSPAPRLIACFDVRHAAGSGLNRPDVVDMT